MIIFSIFFIAYPIKKPKNPPIPIEVANPPIPIEVANPPIPIEVANPPIPIEVARGVKSIHEIIELHIVLVFLEQAYLQKFLRL
jgi:hypothetical protein